MTELRILAYYLIVISTMVVLHITPHIYQTYLTKKLSTVVLIDPIEYQAPVKQDSLLAAETKAVLAASNHWQATK